MSVEAKWSENITRKEIIKWGVFAGDMRKEEKEKVNMKRKDIPDWMQNLKIIADILIFVIKEKKTEKEHKMERLWFFWKLEVLW